MHGLALRHDPRQSDLACSRPMVPSPGGIPRPPGIATQPRKPRAPGAPVLGRPPLPGPHAALPRGLLARTNGCSANGDVPSAWRSSLTNGRRRGIGNAVGLVEWKVSVELRVAGRRDARGERDGGEYDAACAHRTDRSPVEHEARGWRFEGRRHAGDRCPDVDYRSPSNVAGFCFDIRPRSESVKPRACNAARNAAKPSAGSGLPFWPRSLDRMQNCGPRLRIASANRSTLAPASAVRIEPPTNSMKAPCAAASRIWETVIRIGAFMACVTTMCSTPCRLPSRSSINPSPEETWPVARTSRCFAMTATTSLVAGSSSPLRDTLTNGRFSFE